MTESLFSANWYRVSKLKPRLRDAVIVKRQHWRKQLWYLLSDEVTGRQHRINAAAYQFIGRCDGKLTVQQVWDALLVDKEDDAPTQDEVIELLTKINQLELLQYEQTTDTSGLFDRRDKRAKQKQQSYLNPFSIRVPLGDPAPWLNKLDGFAHLLFRPIILVAWLALMLFALLVAGSEWNAITTHASMHMLTPRFLTLSVICFPIIKAFHELSHGLAVRRWRGEVHEFGISLLVFIPAPYVDATAANAFPLSSQRIIVSAAGIMLEMFFAAIALFIWANVQPGLVKDIAFVTMFIGTVSTLVFNGNPLLRFDGYYVLSDFLDIPNLATRSNQYWSQKLRNLITFKQTQPFEMAVGEKKWLLLYAPLSFTYRVIISLIIIFWLGSKWLLLGIFGAVYMAFTVIIKPIFRWVSELLSSGAPGEELNRTRRNLSLLGIALSLLFFVVPVPFSTVAPAVAWLPEKAQIRPDENGFISALPVKNGQQVSTGDLLAVIENPSLTKKREKVASTLEGLRADQFQLLIRDPAKAQNVTQKIISTEKEFARVNEQIANLNIYAQVDGKLVMPKQEDAIGSYVNRGQNIGYVFERTQVRVRAAVSEKDAYFVRNMTNDVNVWMVDSPNTKLPVRMTMDMPSATRELPSAALGDKAGGQFVTDASDEAATSVLEPIFLFDLELLNSNMERVGGTGFVRFEHNPMPLASQLYQRANQLFLTSFEPSV